VRGLELDEVLRVGRRFVLDNGRAWEDHPYQREVIAELCDGVTEVWWEAPEGNAKSTVAAAIGLVHVMLVTRARVLLAAASRDQAGEAVFGQAVGMVMDTPGLSAHLVVQPGHRRILCPATGGKIQVFSASKKTGQGVIPTLVIIDEGHVLPDFGLVRVWRGKLKKRGGQMLLLSNAGERSRVVRDRAHERIEGPSFVMHRLALEEGQDVTDLDLVCEANPLVAREQLEADLASSSWDWAHWARMTCGIAVRGLRGAVSKTEWDALPRREVPEKEPVDVGADFGWVLDTTALVPLWMPDLETRVIGEPKILVPPRDGTSLKPSAVKTALLQIHRRNPIRTVRMDAAAGGRQLTEWIEDPEHGLGAEVIEVGQGDAAQARVYDAWTEAVRLEQLAHPHHEELTAHVLNAIARRISGDRHRFDRPSQSRNAREQDERVIDALIAASGVHWSRLGELLEQGDRKPLDVSDYRILPL